MNDQSAKYQSRDAMIDDLENAIGARLIAPEQIHVQDLRDLWATVMELQEHVAELKYMVAVLEDDLASVVEDDC